MLFKSRRLSYRKYGEEDLQSYLDVAMNEEVMAYITGYSLEREEGVERFEKILKGNALHPRLGCYYVTRLKDGAYIGTSKLTPVEEDVAECEIGYALLPDYWGKGYASEMVATLLEMARNLDLVRQIMGIVDPEHAVSIHILEKYGFEKYDEGTYYDLPAWFYKLVL